LLKCQVVKTIMYMNSLGLICIISADYDEGGWRLQPFAN